MSEPSPTEIAPPRPPGARSLGVRLAALALLLGVTALFFDFGGLMREIERSTTPLRATDVQVILDQSAGLRLEDHVVEEIDGVTYVVVRTSKESASPGDLAPPLRASLRDVNGAEIGWQRLEAEGSQERDMRYRLRLADRARPTTIELSLAAEPRLPD